MLKGKVALVTGASRGIGRSIALRLAKEGASVAVNCVARTAAADSVIAEVRSANGQGVVVRADVGVATQVESMLECVIRELGPIDILVNNAAVYRPGDLSNFDYSQMEAMTRVNVDGMVYLTRAVVSGMKDRRFGRIVNLTSAAAFGTRVSGTTFYAATKAAVVALTRRFAMELGPYGITVNAVSPGFIPTETSIRNRTPTELRSFVDDLAKVTMVGRVGSPEDIAHAVAFMVSPEAGFITAQVLTVDGGRMDYISHP